MTNLGEEYYTGVLYLGYINGPTEGLVIACSLMLASGIYGMLQNQIFSICLGPQIYFQPLTEVFPENLSTLFPSSFRLVDLVSYSMLSIMLFLHIPLSYKRNVLLFKCFSILAVYRVCRKTGKSFGSGMKIIICINS